VCAGNAAAALAIVLLGGPAVAAIAGPRWLAAVPLIRILAVAMFFRAVVVLAGQALDAMRRPALTLRLNAERLAALVIVLPLLGAWGGLPGIAAAVLLANAAVASRALRLLVRVVSD
jgi:O-antigen/teichoic acid export membrane protein